MVSKTTSGRKRRGPAPCIGQVGERGRSPVRTLGRTWFLVPPSGPPAARLRRGFSWRGGYRVSQGCPEKEFFKRWNRGCQAGGFWVLSLSFLDLGVFGWPPSLRSLGPLPWLFGVLEVLGSSPWLFGVLGLSPSLRFLGPLPWLFGVLGLSPSLSTWFLVPPRTSTGQALIEGDLLGGAVCVFYCLARRARTPASTG